MGHHIFKRRDTACRAGFEQGGMKPAAMLVRAFQINIGRPVQVVAFFQHKGVCRAAVKPDIENVCDLLIILCLICVTKKNLRVGVEPRICALSFHRLNNALVYGFVTQNLTGLLVYKDCQWYTPCALTRQHPIGAVFNHSVNSIAPSFGKPVDLVNGFKSFITQIIVLHRHEPLWRVSKN